MNLADFHDPKVRARIEAAAGMINAAALPVLTSDTGSPTHSGKLRERHLHRAFEKWLKGRGVRFIHGRMDRPTDIAVGCPDFTIFGCDNRRGVKQSVTVFVEFKVGRNKLTDHQVDYIKHLEAMGFPVLVSYSVETAIMFVNRYLD